jgi:hypothetical protein
MKRIILGIAMGCMLFGVSIVAAQTGGGYDLTWGTIAGGGDTAMGSGYAIAGTFGQSDAGAQSGGGYTLNGGFWASAASSAVTPVLGHHYLYLPLILK